ncbi:carbon-sulfur lyase activity protein [[Candida] boidinii]|nr:carbon-sulfur lyase activity protein [[Candida] boidinii]
MSESSQLPNIPFGKQFSEEYFPLDKKITPVNHGSFGLPSKPVLEAYDKVFKEDISYPDRFFNKYMAVEIENALKDISTVVNVDHENLAFVPNASLGVNTVLRSYPFRKGDKILIASTIYNGTGKTVKFLENRLGIEIITVNLDYPLSDDEVLSRFSDSITSNLDKDGGNTIKMCVYDTISSMPGFKIPFERITELCKKNGILAMIDAAHSVGIIPVDLKKLQPDFFVSNLHKWFYVPRGCALLYVDPKHHKNIHTTPIAHSYLDDEFEFDTEELEKRRFIDRFIFTGAMNYASYVTVSAAVKFVNETCGGLQNIWDHCNQLARDSSELICEKYNTKPFENEDKTLTTMLFNILIPLDGKDEEIVSKNSTSIKFYTDLKKFVSDYLLDNYNTYTQLGIHNKKLYVRFSAQIYTDIDDFDKAFQYTLEGISKYFETDTCKSYL